MSDPQIERALEEFFEAERLSRRGFIGRAGSTGLALSGLSASSARIVPSSAGGRAIVGVTSRSKSRHQVRAPRATSCAYATAPR